MLVVEQIRHLQISMNQFILADKVSRIKTLETGRSPKTKTKHLE